MTENRQLVSGAIALVIVLSFCAFAIYVGLRPVPSANQHYLDIALGALVAQFANVSAYFFGSSKSAERLHSMAGPPAATTQAAEVTGDPGNAASPTERTTL